jgi:hypothetical protein
MEDVSPSAENEWARSDPFLIPYCNASFLLCYGLKERIVLFFLPAAFSLFSELCVFEYGQVGWVDGWATLLYIYFFFSLFLSAF